MGNWLPLEVLSEVAEYLEEDRDSLVQCTLVCRWWKAVFERLLYRKLDVRSNDLDTSIGDLSLTWFQVLISGAGNTRRSFIKRLNYHIVLPYDLGVWSNHIPDDQAYRKANDDVFRVAITDLFAALSLWENTRFSLALDLVGCQKTIEPGMEETFFDWQEEEQAAAPYQARLYSSELSKLPDLWSISKLLVSDDDINSTGIWSGTTFEIAQCFPTLQTLELDYAAHEDSESQRERRRALTEGIKKLPPTLKTFHYSELDNPIMEMENEPVDLLLGGSDMLAPTMRDFALQLRELKLIGITISPDFLWPLDQTGKPASSTTAVSWPHLETFELGLLPYLPNGECLRKVPHDYPITIKPEPFHRFCIAMGYAARHMPRLTSIEYCVCFEDDCFNRFNFSHYVSKVTATRKGILRWISRWHSEECPVQYVPDERVKNAWGWSQDTEVFNPYGLNKEIIWKLPCWPPESWSYGI
ncbi:hypothetical protein BDW59DRAFT_151926 [Aspergillus cavernicola]|uniref:F-box domain-containing protein n=1 Tax=Aspergillus cavernicola TaxID=176166 RepID=A0ABR4HVI1_9EURO